MKTYFFYFMAVMIPLAVGGWFLYTLGLALWSLFDDWRLSRELDQLQAEGEARREQRRLTNEQRLDNGCDHDFERHAFGFPPDVCSKCGLAREKPSDACDHVWRLNKGPIPGSTCEKCGKTYSLMQNQSLPT